MVFVRALGTAQIDAGDLRITPTATRKFALLLRLAAEPGRRVERAILRELVFPDLAEKNARHSLRDLIYQFRQAGVVLDADTDGLTLVEASSDYGDLIETAQATSEQLRGVQGGFLPGYAPEHSEAFAEWFAGYRARTVLELCRALAKEIARAKSVGDWLRTEQVARACLGLDPTHEEATLALVETVAVSGSKAEALRMLDQYVHDLGPHRSQLQVPVALVKKRITERVRDKYRTELSLPFLGRDAEMRALNERLERARHGDSQCIVLTGDAGIGKSRLAEELCTQASLGGAIVEFVATQPHDTNRPMASLADLVPRLLKHPGALGCSPESMAALKRLTTHDADPGNDSSAVPSELVAAAISRAIADLIDAVTAESTTVLFIDDIQWTDELSRHALSALVASKTRRRLLVILTSRDKSVGRFFARVSERALVQHLTPLAPESTQAMIRRVLDLEDNSELATWLADASAGNPFFLRSLISHFQVTGERFVVPSTLSALLDQQIAALSPEAAAMLGACVALGRNAMIQRIIETLELPHIQVQVAVSELETSRLITQQDTQIRAAHWLVAEAVTRSTSPIALRTLHRRIATILEPQALAAGGSAELWDCAEHWIVSGDSNRAIQLMRACADRSLEIGRIREAAETLLRAAALAPDPDRVPLAVRAVQLADVAGENALIVRGTEFVKACGAVIDYEGFEVAEILARTGEWLEPKGFVERLERWLHSDIPMRHRLRAAMALLIVADLEGMPSVADDVVDFLLHDLDGPESRDAFATLKVQLIYHSVFGDVSKSVAIADRLLEKSVLLEPVEAAIVERMSGVALYRAGHIEAACEALEKSHVNALMSGLLQLQSATAIMLAGLYYDRGLDAPAATWLHRADLLATELGDSQSVTHQIISRADFACARGQVGEARAMLEKGLQMMPANPTKRNIRWLRALELRVHQMELRTTDVDAAVATLTGHHIANKEPRDIADFEVATALHILLDHGQAKRATELLSGFLHQYRRGAGPLSRGLQQAAARLTRTQGSTSEAR